MPDISHADGVVRERRRKTEKFEFQTLVAATYPLFLGATLARRALGRARPAGRRSVFAEAHAAAMTTWACAFMG